MSGTATAAPQCMRALERANKVRLARAALKRQIADGERSATDVILESPWEAASMTVAELLMSQRRWGLIRCRRVLGPIMLSENRKVGALTARQRRALADLVEAANLAPRRGSRRAHHEHALA